MFLSRPLPFIFGYPAARKGYVIFKRGDVLFYVGKPPVQLLYRCIVFIGIFPERFHPALYCLFPALQLGNFRLNLTPPFRVLANLFVFFILFNGESIDLFLIVYQLFFHGIDDIHILLKRRVDVIYLRLDGIPPGFELFNIGSTPVFILGKSLEAKKLNVQLIFKNCFPKLAVLIGFFRLHLQ